MKKLSSMLAFNYQNYLVVGMNESVGTDVQHKNVTSCGCSAWRICVACVRLDRAPSITVASCLLLSRM